MYIIKLNAILLKSYHKIQISFFIRFVIFSDEKNRKICYDIEMKENNGTIINES